MDSLSDCARSILDRMEPDRRYEPRDLQALLPGSSVERVREVMHELWIDRQVERAGYAGWRRVRSGAPHRAQTVRKSQAVKPEELFDHDTFADFFK